MARHRNPRISWVAIVAMAAVPGKVVAASQTFNTALPVTTGNFVYRQQFLYRSATDGSGPTERDLRAAGGVSALGYGVSSRLAAFAAMPYLHKRLSHGTAMGDTARRQTRGIGDIRLWTRYTLVQKNAPGRTFRIVPFTGIESPTGR